MNKLDRSSSEWEKKVEAELSVHDKAIDRWLIQWGLESQYQKNEIKNMVFICFKKYVELGKIRIQGSNDALQFFKVNLQQEQPIRELRSYLRSCLFNQVKQLLRLHLNRKVHQVDIRDLESLGSQISQDDSFYRDNSEKLILLCEIREKMKQLSQEDRRILELFYFEDLSFIEIARQLEIEGFPLRHIDNLRKRKERALEKLRLKY
jgi:DNA-directed RNA polymerase specialized sigma24 family protein